MIATAGAAADTFGGIADMAERELPRGPDGVPMATRQSHPELNDGGEFVWNAAEIGMAFVGYDGRFLKANPFFSQAVGFTEEQLKARTWMDITVEEDIEADRVAVQHVIDGTLPQHRMGKHYKYAGGLERVPVELIVKRVVIGGIAMACLFSQIRHRAEGVQRVAIVRHDPETGETSTPATVMDWIGQHPRITAAIVIYVLFGHDFFKGLIEVAVQNLTIKGPI